MNSEADDISLEELAEAGPELDSAEHEAIKEFESFLGRVESPDEIRELFDELGPEVFFKLLYMIQSASDTDD